jgi:hypothetical protein
VQGEADRQAEVDLAHGSADQVLVCLDFKPWNFEKKLFLMRKEQATNMLNKIGPFCILETS